MLQLDSDISFNLLFAGTSSATIDKTTDHMNNQWQQLPAPGWQPHHRQSHPPSSAALASSYPPSSPRTAGGQSRSLNSSPDHHHPTSNHAANDAYTSGYPSNSFRGYQQNEYDQPHGNGSRPSEDHEHSHNDYYPSAQWAYSSSHHHQSNYGKPASELGLGIDPLPLPHLVVPHHVSAVGNGEDDLYEARMLQEALTTPHFPRTHSANYHHHPQHSIMHPPSTHSHYSSSPFVSAMMEASAPLHHHTSVPTSIYQVRSSSYISSENSQASDSENRSEVPSSSSSATTTGKRKRRGESAPRLCHVEGCHKGIRSRGLCKAHGGGRRCMTPGCTTSDQGGGHCVLHGGGRRCTVAECTKSAQWKGLCKMHGGARRCRYPNCTKNGQVKQGYCRAHHNLISKQRSQEEAAKAAEAHL